MARLFVVIGYPDSKPASKPFPVYVGDNGDEKRAAMEVSTAARFVVLDNPLGVRKNNARSEVNRARLLAFTSVSAAPEVSAIPQAPVPEPDAAEAPAAVARPKRKS